MTSEPEEHPLLPRTPGGGIRSSTAKELDIVVDLEENDPDLEEANDEDKILFADGIKRGTSLILNDAFLLILHILQLFSVIQSLALRWPFPSEWVKGSYFVFLFNLDIWDFMKVHGSETYKEVQGHNTPSALMPFSYWHIMLAWGIFVFLMISAFTISYIIITHRRNPFMMIKVSNLQRCYIIICQIIFIPVGQTIARIFHCTNDGVMEVDNVVKCYEPGLHWAYISPSLAFVIALYIFLPAWMISKTHSELLNLNADKHEGYLQLKETEYVQGLDILYVVNRFHIFASFKKYGCYFRSLKIIFAFAILAVVACTYNHIFIGAVVLTCILFLLFLIFLIIRPYRVSCFNVKLCFSYFCLMLYCLMGALRSSFNSFSLASVWLTPTYMNIVLLIICAALAASMVTFVVYLILRHLDFCKRFCPHPLWPSMTSEGLNKLSPETRKYVRSIIRCRTLIEKSLSMPALFVPAHELSRQVQIINAFCRESEHLRDPIQDTLWDVLDELIEAHSKIAPKSLFAESVKETIRQTATDFMKIMPMVVRRLAQREYDFILVPPVKRRILFKMYCMGVFLNGRREKMEKKKLTLPSVHRVYKPRDDEEFEQDDGYYEDMYPEPQAPMMVRSGTAVSIGVFSDNGLDDEIVLQEAEEWTRSHPLSAGFANQGFEDDVSTILRDDLSDTNLSAMLAGVPSSSRAGSQLLYIDDQSPSSQAYTRPVTSDHNSEKSSSQNNTPLSDSPHFMDRRSSSLSIERTPSSLASPNSNITSPAAERSSHDGHKGKISPTQQKPSVQPTKSKTSADERKVDEDENWRHSPLPGQIEFVASEDPKPDHKVQEISPGGNNGQSEA